MKKTKSYRIGELDQLRINHLKEKFEMTETKIIQIAIQRWYNETEGMPTENELISEYLHDKSQDRD